MAWPAQLMGPLTGQFPYVDNGMDGVILLHIVILPGCYSVCMFPINFGAMGVRNSRNHPESLP